MHWPVQGHGYAPMRKMIDSGCRLAIATDHNPGSSVHQSLPQMMQLCMANGGLTLDEAILGVTHNAAKSVGLEGIVGTLQVMLCRPLQCSMQQSFQLTHVALHYSYSLL